MAVLEMRGGKLHREISFDCSADRRFVVTACHQRIAFDGNEAVRARVFNDERETGGDYCEQCFSEDDR